MSKLSNLATAVPIVRCRALGYRYPGRTVDALADVNLDIFAGEFVLVVGESGAGKSTWLRCLNGLVPHFSGGQISGTMTVADIDVVSSGPAVLSQHVGFVFQNPEAQAVLDVVEAEIAFALENAAIPRAEMVQRVETVLAQLELTQLRNRTIKTLSGGERQRVAIASALVLQPQILVLDEPTSQLDPDSAEILLQTLAKLNRENGLTIILAEHRLERVLGFVDRVIHFDDGQLTTDDGRQSTDDPIASDALQHSLINLPVLPPMMELARRLGIAPLPLALDEAREVFEERALTPYPSPETGEGRRTRNSLVPLSHFGRGVRGKGASISPALETKAITVRYGSNTVLDGVDLVVNSAEITALLGRNGAGKSTLLKCLIGLLKPDAGTVSLNGQPTIDQSIAQISRQVAYLPQNPDDLLFAETVLGELEVTLANHAIDESELVVSVEILLTSLGLTDYANDYPRDLSVGQRQRVALAALLITSPSIILLDEPTRGLDPSTKQAFADMLRGWRDEGKAILLVTHDVELAAQLADRVVVLENGAVTHAGAAQVVLPQHSTFAPQIAQLFPNTVWLTIDDALDGMASSS